MASEGLSASEVDRVNWGCCANFPSWWFCTFAVRQRNRDAKIGRLILKGEDPYRFRINQADFELVNLAFPAIPDVYKDGPHELVNVVVSVKTGAALTKATGLAVLNFLSKKFNTR